MMCPVNAVLQKFLSICTAQKKPQQPQSKLGYSTEEKLETYAGLRLNLAKEATGSSTLTSRSSWRASTASAAGALRTGGGGDISGCFSCTWAHTLVLVVIAAVFGQPERIRPCLASKFSMRNLVLTTWNIHHDADEFPDRPLRHVGQNNP